ncbi:C-type lectin domain family 4 member A-like isoform X2 [Perca fluviatilis]|uniref:C-type lectin domain family 4 member A-like isoform X2 n=1 Tax=Perca fluviatilis TaxID=8168 RepID=UPI001963BF20|nr:C-type lectin domain family 4 member A-like isoform X2 [Perca fluviatilis]
MADYINSQVTGERSILEKRENVHSGGSKVYRVVGVSFGLLCIIQSALNISLWLHRIGCNDQIGDFEMLKDQLVQQQDQIMKLQTERESLKMRLCEMEQKPQGCPQGWRLYMSSCYYVSTVTKTWQNAQFDCEARGAHLVVLNDTKEEDAVRGFGSQVAWIGLRAQRNVRLDSWTWVDGSKVTNTDRIRQPVDQRLNCTYTGTMKWVLSDCNEQHYWDGQKSTWLSESVWACCASCSSLSMFYFDFKPLGVLSGPTTSPLATPP